MKMQRIGSMVAERASATESVDQHAKQRQRPEFFEFVLWGKTTKAPHHFPVFEHFYTPVSHYYASMQMAVLSFGRILGQCLAELHHGTVLRKNLDPVSHAVS